jgi:hypothetical protein
MPRETRRYHFSHHPLVEGRPFTIISDAVMRRVVGKFVRNVNEQGCWSYLNSRVPQTISVSGRRGCESKISGNRLALMLAEDAPIPDGMTANHTCHNGWCVNPLHVYAGTDTENMMDAYLDGRRSVPARTDYNWPDYPRLIRDREARAGRTIKCTRFFCDAVQEEIARGPAMPNLRTRRAA